MKISFRLAMLVAAMSISSLAAADQFNFSYTFADGQNMSGTVDGIRSDDLVTSLILDSVFLNGQSIMGPDMALVGNAYTPSSVMSFSGLNTHIQASGPSSLYYIDIQASGSPGDKVSISEWSIPGVVRATVASDGLAYYWPQYAASRWSLTAAGVSEPAAPVPEPESYAMLLAGLSLMGTIALRRKNKQG